MVLASTGESEVVRCRSCGYAANLEKAEIGELAVPDGGEVADLETVPTPGLKTVEEVCAFLDLPTARMMKTLVYDNENDELVVVLMRGDREVNETKLLNHLGVQHPVLASDERVLEAIGAPPGSLGPVGLDGIRVIADPTVRPLINFSCGANEAGKHHVNVNWGRDCEVAEWVDLVEARNGDPCPRCSTDGGGEGSRLELYRGIEVGHIFQLGDEYSAAMGCTFLDREGQSHPMPMGCYGLGIGRTVAAAIEQNHDDDGIIWPRPLAPFEVLAFGPQPRR